MSKGKVLINEEKNPGSKSVKNLYGKTNVNVAQGPRTGNSGHLAKRSSFQDDKAERGHLADTINRALSARAPKDHIDPKLEPVRGDIAPKKLKRATY